MAVGWACVDDVAQLTAGHVAVSCARPGRRRPPSRRAVWTGPTSITGPSSGSGWSRLLLRSGEVADALRVEVPDVAALRARRGVDHAVDERRAARGQRLGEGRGDLGRRGRAVPLATE